MKLEYSKLVGYLILIICSTHSTFENNNNTSPRVSYPATDHSEECTTLECAYYQRIFREESKTRGFGQSGPDLIRGNGYKLEQHNLTSRDGYIISLFQILSGKDAKEKGHSSRIPVLLHHGVIADGFEWILNKVDTALGYRLPDAGYQVFIINNRGTLYSLEHVNTSWKTGKYWDFSFHEMAAFDVPMIIDYILELTNQPQLYYIAHSMGSSIFMASLSMFPDYNSKIKTFIGLAPAVYVGNTSVPFAIARPILLNHLQEMSNSYLLGSFVNPDFLPFMHILGTLCYPQIISRKICFAALEVIFGYDFIEDNYDLRQEIVSIGLSSTSVKTLLHLMQLWKSGKFQKYDYLENNFEIYGQMLPPLYELDKVTAPVFVFCGAEDQLVSCRDAFRLASALPNLKEFHKINQQQFNHIDFLFATNVNSLLNDKILEILNMTINT